MKWKKGEKNVIDKRFSDSCCRFYISGSICFSAWVKIEKEKKKLSKIVKVIHHSDSLKLLKFISRHQSDVHLDLKLHETRWFVVKRPINQFLLVSASFQQKKHYKKLFPSYLRNRVTEFSFCLTIRFFSESVAEKIAIFHLFLAVLEKKRDQRAKCEMENWSWAWAFGFLGVDELWRWSLRGYLGLKVKGNCINFSF